MTALNRPTEVIISPLAVPEIERLILLPDLLRRGQRVQAAAKAQIRFGHVHAGRQDSPGRTQSGVSLADTIVKRVISSPMGAAVRVGSDSDHAIFVHEGTRPHVIQARNKQALYFYSGGFGGFVLVPLLPRTTGTYVNGRGVLVSPKGYVNHPGTQPNRFLTGNLHLAVL